MTPGIVPDICLDHGMTFSYYYSDPDGNHVELQCDVFGDWAKSSDWMRNSVEFQEDPLGKFVDPEKVAADRASGVSFEEIHAKAMAGGYAPETSDDPGRLKMPGAPSRKLCRAGSRQTAARHGSVEGEQVVDRQRGRRIRARRGPAARAGPAPKVLGDRAELRRPHRRERHAGAASSRSSSTSR